MTGRVTEAMTERYSHVEAEEKSDAVNPMIAAVQKAENEALAKADKQALEEAENQARKGPMEERVAGLVAGSPQDAKTAGEDILVIGRYH